MKFKCVKNIKPGFFGYDYSSTFKVGETYSVFTHHMNINVYSNVTNEWEQVYHSAFIEMFAPGE